MKRLPHTSATWPVFHTTEQPMVKYFKLTYEKIAPVNIALSLLIVLLNSLVVAHYFHNRTKITFVLFLLISVSDIMTAVGNFAFAGGILLWATDINTYDNFMWWCLIVYRLVGLLGYSCSILFNTFLAVLRSVKVCNPFYQPKIWLLKLSGLLYILLLLGLTAYDLDMVIRNQGFSSFLNLWYFVASVEERSPYPGSTIPWGIFVASGFSNTLSSIVQFTILSVIYILPVAVVMVSMIIQVYIGVLRTQARNDESVVINDWSHVNTTVFLLASGLSLSNLQHRTLPYLYHHVHPPIRGTR